MRDRAIGSAKLSVDLHNPTHSILQLFGVEAEGAGLALVRHATGCVNQVEAIGPRRVRLLGGVTEFVEHRGNVDSQLAHAGSGDGSAFLFAPRTRENNLLFYVALHLPDIAGMRLGDVDHEERDLTSILLVELVEGRNLPPEGRSSVASKDEHDRLALGRKRR